MKTTKKQTTNAWRAAKGGFTPVKTKNGLRQVEVCGTCLHDVSMHVVVTSGKQGGPEKVRMECLDGNPRDVCLCMMDPVQFWKETLIEFHRAGPVKPSRDARETFKEKL